ncbi:MAG: BatD family protein [Alphaproteobacteria bacterium]|nr:BatD family protein [Alphaproteobacteria bacterium]
MLKQILSVITIVLLSNSACLANELTARLSQNEVALGDSFELTLTYDGNDATAMQIDLGNLQNDFAVYSTSSSIRSSYVNGIGQMQRQWKIGLMPKRTGSLIIPAIKAGQYTSKPLNINVLPAGSSVKQQTTSQTQQASAQAEQVEVNLQIDNEAPYVQQELNAVLVINDNKGIEFAAEPQFITDADEWVVKSLRQPTVEANGNGGRLIKFYYALFPQKSGLQQIPSMQIEGYYTAFDDNNQMSGFGGFSNFFNMNMSNLFGVKKPIRLITKPQNINVLPIAADYGNDWWLPAEAVGVAARWVDDKPIFKVGETVAREIAFAAEGVSDTQLPEIILPTDKKIKQYPEKPQIEAIADNNHITSQMKMRIVYIPQVSGKQTIPEIKIPWYNVNSKQKQYAIIPAVTIDVEANANVADMVQTNEDAKINKQPNEKKKTAENINLPMQPWLWIVIAFIAGILLSYVLLKLSLQKKTNGTDINLSAIEQNLKQKDYRQLRDSLIEYGKTIFKNSNINNLNDLVKYVDEEKFAEQMQLLNSILYAGKTAELDTDAVLAALRKKNKKHATKDESPLPKLYK